MKRVMLIGNFDEGVYKFRKELIEELLKFNCEVVICTPYGAYIPLLEEMGCQYEKIEYNRAGKNPLKELELLIRYHKLLKKENIDVVLLYTIKPTLYAGIVCRLKNIPFLVNITGLSPAITNSSILRKMSFFVYRRVLKHAKMVFFQNADNLKLFKEQRTLKENYKQIPGSGINLKEHIYEKYESGEKIRILYVGRITKVKGIDELLEAIEDIMSKDNRYMFEFIGMCDEVYKEKIQDLQEQGKLLYYGVCKEPHEYIKQVHAVIMPSYGEGMSNVLLEASACGRPILASNVTGCKEIVLDGKTGFLFEAHSTAAILKALERLAQLSDSQREEMGKYGCEYVRENYSREIIIESYMDEIKKIFGGTENEFV